ncbi:MAG: outer membrane lipoprotein-sorting protein [Treponema sp.]|nr:outer membrane lipoprotein-sorting protein [Treponema sp.]
MKKLSLFAFTLTLTTSLFAQSLTGYDIAKRADSVEKGKTSSYTATMTLTNKKDAKRVREVMMKEKDFGDTTKTVVVFTVPKDVAGVAYLMFEYDEKADGTKPDSDNWLYMPAMKKVRRISGSTRQDDFMGTDFTYEDMGERGLSKDTFTLLGTETVDGTDCYKVEAVAKDKGEKNPRRILWWRTDNYLLQKAEFYDKQNTLQRELTCSDITQISGIWTTGKMFIKNVQTGHSTLLEMKDVQYNVDLSDSLFTVTAIERGTVR